MNWKDLQRYRTPLLLGIGGIVAWGAFQRARTGQVAPTDSQTVPAPASPTGLTPEAALAVQSQAFMAGGGLGLQGAALGLQTAERGLDLAGIATMGAQALAGDVVGLASNLGTTLGQVASDVVGTLPSFAPATGLPSQPVTQPPPPTGGGTPTPTPTPTPTVTVKSRTAEYRIRISASSYPTAVKYGSVSSTGAITGSRSVSFASGSWAPVARVVSGSRLHWRTSSGGLSGWSLVPGWSTGAWLVEKRYREALSNGTTRYTTWTRISNTGS